MRVAQEETRLPDAPYEPDLDRLSRALGSAAEIEAGKEVMS
jgi:hypothetical protein